MDKLRNKFINFMYGRSGPDSLYKATMIACIVLMIINLFACSIILNLLIWALLIISNSCSLPTRQNANLI